MPELEVMVDAMIGLGFTAVRGPEDRGVVGMECTSCHQDKNVELARVPGAPNWHLAPRSNDAASLSNGTWSTSWSDPWPHRKPGARPPRRRSLAERL